MQVVYASSASTRQDARLPSWKRSPTTTAAKSMKKPTNIFRVLVKTLLNAGIITDRTRGFYAMYVDMDELKREGDRMVGDDIAEEGIRFLQGVNFAAKKQTFAQLAAE